MAIQYKQKCIRCKTNYIVVTRRTNYAICFDCQRSELNAEIEDPEMQKLFDIPDEFYKENSFLRNIKLSYIRFGSLSEKQIEAFKNTVETMKSQKSEQENDKDKQTE